MRPMGCWDMHVGIDRTAGRGRKVFGAVASTLTAVMVLVGAAISGAGAAAAATTTPAHPVLAPQSGSYVFTLTFDGLRRDYRLHVPPAATSGQALPLVVNLH